MRQSRIYEDLLPSEQVTARLEELESFPPNCNAMHHDSFRMGSDLVRGWTAMHDGFDSADTPRALHEVILVNQRTGQRFAVNFSPTVARPRAIIPFGLEEDHVDSRVKLNDVVLVHEYRNKVFARYYNLLPPVDTTTLYVYTERQLIRLDTFLLPFEYEKAIEETWCDGIINYEQVKVGVLKWMLGHIRYVEEKVPPYKDAYQPFERYGWHSAAIEAFVREHASE